MFERDDARVASAVAILTGRMAEDLASLPMYLYCRSLSCTSWLSYSGCEGSMLLSWTGLVIHLTSGSSETVMNKMGIRVKDKGRALRSASRSQRLVGHLVKCGPTVEQP